MPVQLLDEYIGAPGGCCFVCKAARRPEDRVLDFDVDVEELSWVGPSEEFKGQFYVLSGALQVCSTCIVEAASLLGLIAADKADDLRDEIKELMADNQALMRRAEIAEAALEALRRYDEADA